jgi:prepilin-type processing-associated H-X9-DG protein
MMMESGITFRKSRYYYLIHQFRIGGHWTQDYPWGGHPTHNRQPIPMDAVVDPSTQVMLMDIDRLLVREIDYPPGFPPPNVTRDPVYGERRNYLFFDGRVESKPVASPTS